MTADPISKPRPRRWKAALIVLGSAAFGGVAFALWNRGELAQIHNLRNGDQQNAPETEGAPSEQFYEELI